MADKSKMTEYKKWKEYIKELKTKVSFEENERIKELKYETNEQLEELETLLKNEEIRDEDIQIALRSLKNEIKKEKGNMVFIL